MRIETSVGIGASNRKSDVSKVCALINKNRHLLYGVHGQYSELAEDGTFTDQVTERIVLFQRRVVTESATQDGRVDPDGRTLAKLIANARDIPGDQLEPLLFPFTRRPTASYRCNGRQFRANRNGGQRKHAACDLLFSPGVSIRAVADGTVIQPAYPFYGGTDALEVDHGTFTVRYGEIMPGSVPAGLNRRGATVSKGEIIAKVGRLNSGSSMLHFEMYSGSETGSLTGISQFERRSDLLDCTDFLDFATLDIVECGDAEKEDGEQTGEPGEPPVQRARLLVSQDVETRLRVRDVPDTAGAVIARIGKGTVVTSHGMVRGDTYSFRGAPRDEWVLIEHGSTTGYVAAAFLEEVKTDAPTLSYVVSDHVETRLHLRFMPDTSSAKMFSLRAGTMLKYHETLTGSQYAFDGHQRADWAAVEYLGKRAYAAAAFIEPFAGRDELDREITEGGELNKILFEYEPTGASDATARQDRLPQQGITDIAASDAMAKTDLGRVQELKAEFLLIGVKYGLPPALLGAIASRESRCGNVLDGTGHGDGGHGFGIMQIDDRSWHADKSEGPKGRAHIDQAAAILAHKLETTEQTPGLDDVQALATAVSRYNGGRGFAFPRSDEGTTGADYMNDVWQRARYYAARIDWCS